MKISLAPVDKFLDKTALLVISLLWCFAIFAYFSLPETIPIHFDAEGQINNYGSRLTVFILPVFGTFIFLGLTFLNKHPNLFTYAATVTPENAEIKYTYAMRLLRFLKVAILIIFSFLSVYFYLAATGKVNTRTSWIIILFVFAFIQIPVVYYIVRSLRKT